MLGKIYYPWPWGGAGLVQSVMIQSKETSISVYPVFFLTSESNEIRLFGLFFAQYYLWRFPADEDTVLVKALSSDTQLCAILSIQGTQV